MSKVLVVAAHPDDEVLMCGGTIKRLRNEGDEVRTLILGEGAMSRDGAKEEEIYELRESAIMAGHVLGVDNVTKLSYPDNCFDTVPLLKLIKSIKPFKDDYGPDTIITHHWDDLNIDHQRTYQAVMTCCRPMNGETVKKIFSGEVLSSTEWRYPNSFNPNLFYNISKTLSYKVEAFLQYKSERRAWPHPRSVEAIKMNAHTWGAKVGVEAVEPFEVARWIV